MGVVFARPGKRGTEVIDLGWRRVRDQLCDRVVVTQVGLHGLHLVNNVGYTGEVARPVGHHNIVSALGHQHANDLGTDKPGATSNQNGHAPSFPRGPTQRVEEGTRACLAPVA